MRRLTPTLRSRLLTVGVNAARVQELDGLLASGQYSAAATLAGQMLQFLLEQARQMTPGAEIAASGVSNVLALCAATGAQDFDPDQLGEGADGEEDEDSSRVPAQPGQPADPDDAGADASDAVPSAPAPRPTLAALAARQQRTGRRSAAPRRPGGQLVAGTTAATAAGLPIGDREALAAAVLAGIERPNGMAVRFTTTYPEARRLPQDGPVAARLLDAALAPQALVAAGGLCAPVANDYSAFNLAVDDRPVRDGLPAFQADRGGVNMRPATKITDATGAVGVWTVQDDIDAGLVGAPDPTKPRLQITCGAFQTTQIKAITLRLLAGNISTRYDPEGVLDFLDVALAAHARLAEQTLITKIAASSTAVTGGGTLGAVRELFDHVDRAAAAYRTRHRMPDRATLRAIFPTWLRDMLRVDLTRQLPGDSTTAITDAMIDAHFSVRGIIPIWNMDDVVAMAGTQAAGALAAWPTTVTWYLYPEGSLVFLDAGVLDLGWIRDSTLNSTNDREFFMESFEEVHFRGPQVLAVTSTIAPSGTSKAAA